MISPPGQSPHYPGLPPQKLRPLPHHLKSRQLSQQTRDTEPMLGGCWAGVCAAGPTSTQHCFNVPRFLRSCPMKSYGLIPVMAPATLVLRNATLPHTPAWCYRETSARHLRRGGRRHRSRSGSEPTPGRSRVTCEKHESHPWPQHAGRHIFQSGHGRRCLCRCISLHYRPNAQSQQKLGVNGHASWQEVISSMHHHGIHCQIRMRKHLMLTRTGASISEPYPYVTESPKHKIVQ